MENEHRNSPRHIRGAGVSTMDHARAYEGMRQAMALGNLTLEACSHVRSLLRSVGQALGRGMVPKRSFTKSGATYFD